MTSRQRMWKRLDEREQDLFERWLAGWIADSEYVLRWREIDEAFRRLGSVLW